MKQKKQPKAGPPALAKELNLDQRMPMTVQRQGEAQNVRVENCVGFAQTPLGLAGPLTVNGQNQQGICPAAEFMFIVVCRL